MGYLSFRGCKFKNLILFFTSICCRVGVTTKICVGLVFQLYGGASMQMHAWFPSQPPQQKSRSRSLFNLNSPVHSCRKFSAVFGTLGQVVKFWPLQRCLSGSPKFPHFKIFLGFWGMWINIWMNLKNPLRDTYLYIYIIFIFILYIHIETTCLLSKL